MGPKKEHSPLQNTLDDYKETFALQADHDKSKIASEEAKEMPRKAKPQRSKMKANSQKPANASRNRKLVKSKPITTKKKMKQHSISAFFKKKN